LLIERKQMLGTLLAREQGKTLSNAMFEDRREFADYEETPLLSAPTSASS
jgi:hypothetical protein